MIPTLILSPLAGLESDAAAVVESPESDFSSLSPQATRLSAIVDATTVAKNFLPNFFIEKPSISSFDNFVRRHCFEQHRLLDGINVSKTGGYLYGISFESFSKYYPVIYKIVIFYFLFDFLFSAII